MPEQLNYDVFISYRRLGAEVHARLLFEVLKDHYNVFLDNESLTTGKFEEIIHTAIRGCRDVIVILSHDSLERCNVPGDHYFKEIKWALEEKAKDPTRTVIPLFTKDFVMPTNAELSKYPPEINELLSMNGQPFEPKSLDELVAFLHRAFSSEKRETPSPFDSISEWVAFNRCLGDRKFAEMLPSELKMSIINNAVDSFLDEYNAKIIRSVINSTANMIYDVKTSFNYSVEIRSDFNFRIDDIDETKYYELTESFNMSKIFRTKSPSGELWIGFITSLDELDFALRSANFIFRENLAIDKEDFDKIISLDERERERFYSEVLRVRLNVNKRALSPVELVFNAGGIFAKYEITDQLYASSADFDVRLRFRVPQLYSNSYFFASISEPTYSPTIEFTYPEDEFDVDMIPFFDRSLTSKDTKIFEGTREISLENEWVLPVSGAIFLIHRINGN